jgi:hypothetical protein
VPCVTILFIKRTQGALKRAVADMAKTMIQLTKEMLEQAKEDFLKARIKYEYAEEMHKKALEGERQAVETTQRPLPFVHTTPQDAILRTPKPGTHIYHAYMKLREMGTAVGSSALNQMLRDEGVNIPMNTMGNMMKSMVRQGYADKINQGVFKAKDNWIENKDD